MNKKEQFKVALKIFLDTHSFYYVNEYLIFRSNIIFQHPVAFKYSLHSIITVFNATFSTSKVALKTVIFECKEL
jgi:hypothetical protein